MNTGEMKMTAFKEQFIATSTRHRLFIRVSTVVTHAFIADTFNYGVIVQLLCSNSIGVTTYEVVKVDIAAYNYMVDQLLPRLENLYLWLRTLFISGLVI